MNNQHLVLVNANGRQANRKNAWLFALQIWAEQEIAAGRGGGIISLLIPKNAAEQKKLNDVKKKYQLKLVKQRFNQERKKLRNFVARDITLMVQILECYDQDQGHIPNAIRIKKIAAWVCRNLQNHQSKLCKIIIKHNYALADRQSPGWWEKQFAAFRALHK